MSPHWLLAFELPIIALGVVLGSYFASDPYTRRLRRAYRKHRQDIEARRHIAYYADLLNDWSRRG